MKISIELLLVLFIVIICSVVALGLLLQHLWPIALLVFVGYMVYRHKYPKQDINSWHKR